MDGMTNGDGCKLLCYYMMLTAFRMKSRLFLCDYGVRNEKCVRCEGVMTGHDALKNY